MLTDALWVLLSGLFAGQLARRLGLPPLVGMVLAGVALGPEVGAVLSQDMLSAADALRTVAIMVILMRAGLGLDREKLMQQGTVALRLGCLPALTEAIAIALMAMAWFQFDGLTGLLLGCVVAAESPAVIVPGMLRLKSLGWGIAKGIPDVILIGSALSDVLVLLCFSLLLRILERGQMAGQRHPKASPPNFAPGRVRFRDRVRCCSIDAMGTCAPKLDSERSSGWCNHSRSSIEPNIRSSGLALLFRLFGHDDLGFLPA